MMNRSTQKELIKLMLQLNEMWPQLDLSNSEQQNMVLDILNTISAKCQKDFSKANADRYADTMESLGQVIKMTDWQHMGREELAQCVSLCQDIILQVINNLRNEKELKKDIVFLPYQASMWDSLESVWKAANEDKEHCNTYVIPIPYASLTPEHTAAEWHCERYLFPEYVPTLDWQTIDLEEMHPDVIFIHNPYDEYNHVTSVESRYYSRNLKKCTDKLVYIPYSVEEEIQPGNEAAENAIEHRVLLPAFFNADLIIAQSEDMRQAWINILTRRTNMNNRAYWEKRILSLGSPKIDKVLTSKKEDFEMPEKWRKLIGNKKVILYITSIAPTLQNSDKVCAKLQYVFDIFRNRDDVVLWWRPHPLMKATFHSMRPQYEEEYISIEKKYIDEGWGIYDDSADLHRAICWSDVYYGDQSSIVNLYRLTEKPIMIEDFYNVGIEKGILPIMGRCAVADGDDLWIFSVYANALLRFSLETEHMLECYPFPENLWEYAVFNFVKVDQCLYFAPCYARECWRFDIKNKNFEIIDIGLTDSEKLVQDKFRSVVACNGKIYIFGWNLPTIVVLDLATGRYERIDGWVSKLEAAGIKTDSSLINMFYAVGDDEIFVPIQNGPYILLINTKYHIYRLKQISKDTKEYFCAIHYKSGNLYITNNKDETIIWNLKHDKVQRMQNNFLSGQNVDYGYIFKKNSETIYIPFTFSFIGYKTAETELFRRITLPINLLEKYPDGIYCKYAFVIRVGDMLYLQSVLDGKVYVVCLDDESVRVCNFSVDEQLRSMIQKRKKKIFLNRNQRPLEENEVLSLDTLLEADTQKITGLLQDEKSFVGRKIYRACVL